MRSAAKCENAESRVMVDKRCDSEAAGDLSSDGPEARLEYGCRLVSEIETRLDRAGNIIGLQVMDCNKVGRVRDLSVGSEECRIECRMSARLNLASLWPDLTFDRYHISSTRLLDIICLPIVRVTITNTFSPIDILTLF